MLAKNIPVFPACDALAILLLVQSVAGKVLSIILHCYKN